MTNRRLRFLSIHILFLLCAVLFKRNGRCLTPLLTKHMSIHLFVRELIIQWFTSIQVKQANLVARLVVRDHCATSKELAPLAFETAINLELMRGRLRVCLLFLLSIQSLISWKSRTDKFPLYGWIYHCSPMNRHTKINLPFVLTCSLFLLYSFSAMRLVRSTSLVASLGHWQYANLWPTKYKLGVLTTELWWDWKQAGQFKFQ